MTISKAYSKKSSRVICRMTYLQPYINRFMLSYSIVMPVTMSTAVMNMMSLTSTATIEFTENTGNIVTASTQQQVITTTTTSEGGGARNK
jgi:hypothetical protein